MKYTWDHWVSYASTNSYFDSWLFLHFTTLQHNTPLIVEWYKGKIGIFGLTPEIPSCFMAFFSNPYSRDANLLRILGVRPQESNPHALHLLIAHCTAPIVILGRLCIQKITDPYSYGLTVCII